MFWQVATLFSCSLHSTAADAGEDRRGGLAIRDGGCIDPSESAASDASERETPGRFKPPLTPF
jgi:hypothetical protein